MSGEVATEVVAAALEDDAVFRWMYEQMDAAPEHYSLVSSDVSPDVSADWGTWVGQSWQIGADNPMPLTASLVPYHDEKTVGLAVFSATSLKREAAAKHELAHLFGIHVTGTIYQHPDGEPTPWIFRYFPIP